MKKNKIQEPIDLTNLNLFETTKEIIMLTAKNPSKKFKCKVSTPNFQNILDDLPLSNLVEIV